MKKVCNDGFFENTLSISRTLKIPRPLAISHLKTLIGPRVSIAYFDWLNPFARFQLTTECRLCSGHICKHFSSFSEFFNQFTLLFKVHKMGNDEVAKKQTILEKVFDKNPILEYTHGLFVRKYEPDEKYHVGDPRFSYMAVLNRLDPNFPGYKHHAMDNSMGFL